MIYADTDQQSFFINAQEKKNFMKVRFSEGKKMKHQSILGYVP